MKAILIGIIASLFFATTFVLNRAMDLSGGSWIWSAALRYFFTLPFLVAIVMTRQNLRALLDDMRAGLLTWLTWSTIGFGLFYAPICFASAYGPAWLVAGTWQITIVAGSLLVPFIYGKGASPPGKADQKQQLPIKELCTSFFILIGVGLLQIEDAVQTELSKLVLGFLPVLVAAFAYPLGNRKMMLHCQGRLDVYQRVLGMTIASLPFWIALSLYGVGTVGLPGAEQVVQSFVVAICSGVIATVLFFYATDLTKGNARQLAGVEATQAGEVVFTIIGEALLLSSALPAGWPLAGIVIITLGMIMHSLNSRVNSQ